MFGDKFNDQIYKGCVDQNYINTIYDKQEKAFYDQDMRPDLSRNTFRRKVTQENLQKRKEGVNDQIFDGFNTEKRYKFQQFNKLIQLKNQGKAFFDPLEVHLGDGFKTKKKKRQATNKALKNPDDTYSSMHTELEDPLDALLFQNNQQPRKYTKLAEIMIDNEQNRFRSNTFKENKYCKHGSGEDHDHGSHQCSDFVEDEE